MTLETTPTLDSPILICKMEGPGPPLGVQEEQMRGVKAL